MGTEAKNGRKALIDHVKTCISQVNSMTKLAGEVREANNALAEQTGIDVKKLGDRIDTQGKWLKTIEDKQVVQFRQTRTQVELGASRLRAFASMTLFERLRWILTGRCPGFSEPWTDPLPVTPPPAKATTIAAPEHVASHGYIPQTLGPRVLP